MSYLVKIKATPYEDDPKNEDDLKNEDNPKNEEDPTKKITKKIKMPKN